MSEPLETPIAELPAIPSDTLWTSDSQRADTVASSTEFAPDQPEPVPAESPDVAAPDVAAVESARDGKGQFTKPAGKPRSSPQARVEQATAREALAKDEVRQAREETAALKRRLDAIEQARPQERAQERPAPAPAPGSKFASYDVWSAAQPEDAQSYEDYIDARTTHNYQQLHAAQTAQQRVTAFHTAANADPELAAALERRLPASAVMNQAMLDSPHSLDILRYLSTHPEECGQLARDTASVSLDAVPVMRRYLESQVTPRAVARLDAAPSVQPSTASPPIHRVGGTASATPVDPEDLEFGPDYIRQENAREKSRQAARRW